MEVSAKNEHPYSPFVSRVQKPSRYVGGEFGQQRKNWDTTTLKARVCLAFPDLYDIGMSHLGLKILYSLLNDSPDFLAERVFSPWVDMEQELRARNIPLLSLESHKPLCDFDVLGFSLQYELTYTNVLQILDLGRIPLRSADRPDNAPLVVAGGPIATHPEPLALFIDAFVIGDGEEAFPSLLRAWSEAKAKGFSRLEALKELSKLRGVYVPALYELAEDGPSGFLVVRKPKEEAVPHPVQRAIVADINQFPFPTGGPVPNPEAVFDRISVEISRGCTEGCRFCQAGMIYRPVRERTPNELLRAVTESVENTGFDEVALTSLSTADYSSVSPLVREVMQRLEKQKVALSVSSLRAYGLDETLLDEIQKIRATGLTFAPEAGTQRMRNVINKNVTEEQLMQTAERVFSRGWSKMKLYFMMGLPTEREEDVIGIVETGRKAQDVGRSVQKGRGPSVTVSVSTFVPKPHTPFQWCALDSYEEIRRKHNVLLQESRRAGVDLKTHDARSSVLEATLARGDRRIAYVIERVFQLGQRFDSWDEQLNLDRWKQAFAETNVSIERYLNTIPLSAELPWSHLDVGLEDGFLAREYRKAMKDQLSPPCGKTVGQYVHHNNVQSAQADTRKLVCYDCGIACDLTAIRNHRFRALNELGADSPLVTSLIKQPRTPEERRPKVQFVQEDATRYRMKLRKLGSAAYLSHLDWLRSIPRLLRREHVPLYYTQGFHPKADMIFGPALSVGIASLAEYVDVKIAGRLPEEIVAQLPKTLTENAIDGVTIERFVELGPNDVNVSKLLGDGAYARYSVAVARTVVTNLFGNVEQKRTVRAESILKFEVEGQLEGGRLTALRDIDGIKKRIYVRDYLTAIIVDSDKAHNDLNSAGILGDIIPVEVVVRLSSSGGVKIAEVMEAFFGADCPFQAVRGSMWFASQNTKIEPDDLARIRNRHLIKELYQAP